MAKVFDYDLDRELFGASGPRDPDVTMTIPKDWFHMSCYKQTKPSVVTVQRYWNVLKQPLDAMSGLQTLYMIKKALIEWPKMGAAIAKLALKEYKIKQQAKKLKHKREWRASKKALKEFTPKIPNTSIHKRRENTNYSMEDPSNKLHRNTKKGQEGVMIGCF